MNCCLLCCVFDCTALVCIVLVGYSISSYVCAIKQQQVNGSTYQGISNGVGKYLVNDSTFIAAAVIYISHSLHITSILSHHNPIHTTSVGCYTRMFSCLYECMHFWIHTYPPTVTPHSLIRVFMHPPVSNISLLLCLLSFSFKLFLVLIYIFNIIIILLLLLSLLLLFTLCHFYHQLSHTKNKKDDCYDYYYYFYFILHISLCVLMQLLCIWIQFT